MRQTSRLCDTDNVQIVATHMWNYLGDDTAGFHQRGVELLHLLHQLAPTPWVVEDVVGNGLLSDDKVGSQTMQSCGRVRDDETTGIK